jgi:hypothetical protein
MEALKGRNRTYLDEEQFCVALSGLCNLYIEPQGSRPGLSLLDPFGVLIQVPFVTVRVFSHNLGFKRDVRNGTSKARIKIRIYL